MLFYNASFDSSRNYTDKPSHLSMKVFKYKLGFITGRLCMCVLSVESNLLHDVLHTYHGKC